MVRPAKIETLDDVKTWITDNDARNDVYWHDQHALNDRTRKELWRFDNRLGACERKIALVAGLAAAFGGTLGGLLTKIFA